MTRPRVAPATGRQATWRTCAASCAVLALALFARPVEPRAQSSRHTQLVIVVDGLRPDDVTAEVMPRLTRIGARGIVLTSHHSVFPTVTRVNAASFVTGVYPEAHGLLGNTIFIPKANATKGLDTGQRENLELVERADGRLLTAPTLSEILRAAGKRLLVVSSGSSGSALLLNHTLAAGGIVNVDFVRPPALSARVAQVLGTVPPHATPNDAQNQFAVDAYLKLKAEIDPDVTFMWLSDPDGTAHANGLGAARTRESLTLVDRAIGRVEDTLQAEGLLDRTNIIVTSDHGFSTHTGELKLSELAAPFARTLPDGSPDIVVAEGAIYFRGAPDRARVAALITALQQRPEVGAIFTRGAGGRLDGGMAGTLSFEAARWDHRARAGDILVSANWTDGRNAAGFAGTTTDGGVAGHGASSPYDIHNTFMAAGPDFRERATSAAPTGNVDVTPTVLRLLGLPVPAAMAGRVIDEALRGGPDPGRVQVTHSTETVKNADGSYALTASFSTVARHRYLDRTEVRRSAAH